MDKQQITSFVEEKWQNSILPALQEYITIPNKSPFFDANWEQNGHMDKAMELVVAWCRKQPVAAMQLEVLRLPGKTPLLFIEIPGSLPNTALLYGHIDKQPEMKGWDEGKGPWQPVLEGDKLYGRGAADDGYAVFASLTAIAALQQQGLPHGRCVLLIEASEESGSPDLPAYLESLSERIGTPELVVCLDSGCGNYETLWSTTSLRGVVSAELSIKIQREGMHSGVGSGIIPSWFHALQRLLARLEDPLTGEVCLEGLKVPIPALNVQQAERAAGMLGEGFFGNFTLLPGVSTVSQDVQTLLLNQSWRPALTVTGIEGIPSLQDAGNVTLPQVAVKLSLRIPPTCDGAQACTLLKETLEKNPPFGVQTQVTKVEFGNGWKAPETAPWLQAAADLASESFFGQKAAFFGEGGSIPFMAMLGKKYPQAQFLITGVLGPRSNAHGPNEFLHLPAVKKVTCCIASLLLSHFKAFSPAADKVSRRD